MTEFFGLDDFEPRQLDGYTIDDLTDYLERGRTPRDESIESSAGCQIALASLERLRELSRDLLTNESGASAPVSEGWVSGILSNIGREARSGRTIPLQHGADSVDLSITEGAVRGLIRQAGDSVPGVIIGSCVLRGDVTSPGEPIAIEVSASAFVEVPLLETADRIRRVVYDAVRRHTELTVSTVDVVIDDVLLPISDESASDESASDSPSDRNGVQ